MGILGTNKYTTEWTTERLGLLQSISKEGSNSWIAEQINIRTGSTFTRNSIISKKHREGIGSACGPRQRVGNQVPPKPRKRKAKPINWFISGSRNPVNPDLLFIKKIEAKPQPAEFLGIELWNLKDGHCRYPRGTAAPYLYCGQPTKEDSSYCAYCHSLCYDRVRTRQSQLSAATTDYLVRA